MIAVTLAEVEALVGGRLVAAGGAAVVRGDVEVDSRLVSPVGLFVALAGARTDGHAHVDDAVRRGAVAALTARPVGDAPCVVVDDPLVALQRLASALWIRGGPPLTVGITGSSGKTSTKDLVTHLLLPEGPVLSPPGSFNNEIGLPLTALRRTSETAFAVLEYSARGRGHVAFLRDLVAPTVACVLNVGSAHLGEFGSREAIAEAKTELVEQTPDGRGPSVAVLNADDPLVRAMAARTDAPVLTFGRDLRADVRAGDVAIDALGRASFVLEHDGERAPVALQLRGEHAVANALAAAAAVLAARRLPGGPKSDLAALAARLGSATPASRWRMEVTERSDGVTIVNDAYNANPESMRAALKTLAVMSDGKARRTVAVLGHMAELGPAERDEHFDLGRFVVRLDIGQLVVVGPSAGGIHAGAVLEGSWGSESIHVEDVEAAVRLLHEQLEPGDVVLLKGSRSAGLERVADALLAGEPQART